MSGSSRSVIPAFTQAGLLPPGDYGVSFDELRDSILVKGPEGGNRSPHWDGEWRLRLVENLEVLTRQHWAVGVRAVFADGSFAEDKDHPNDIDGYFVCSLEHLKDGSLERDLNLLEKEKIWTWDPKSRRPCPGYPKLQLPMWHKYRVELYPHIPDLGLGSGILDRHGNELEFPSAFRQSRRDGTPRGIVKLLDGGRDDSQRT